MTLSIKFFIFLFFLILCPVLNLGGHYINLAEFYLYLMFLINLKSLRRNVVAIIFIKYAGLFFAAVLFTSFIAQKNVNNHDLFILRNCLQLICAILLFQFYSDNFKKNYKEEQWQKIFYQAVFALALPALFVFLQRMNFFGFRQLMVTLYQPKFHFLTAELFEEHRYTSIFKDFFTSSVYFIILSLSIVILYLKTKLSSKYKISLLVLLFCIYLVQFYVARTSVIFIPAMVILTLVLVKKKNIFGNIRNALIFFAFCLPAYFFFDDLFIHSESLNSIWANEGMSSYQVMQGWNKNFLDHLLDNPDILLRPLHDYDLSESMNPQLYTDSFYPQEIYRYGIYGMISYFYLVLALMITFFRNERGLFIITLCLVFLNYKGGNVFFMPKDIYLLAFVFSWFYGWEKQKITKEVLA